MNILNFTNSLALYAENQYKDPNKIRNLEIFLTEAIHHLDGRVGKLNGTAEVDTKKMKVRN